MRRLIPAVCMSTTRDTRIQPQILSRFARGNASVQQLFQTEDTFPDSRRTRSALISGHWPVHPPPFARGDKVHLADPAAHDPQLTPVLPESPAWPHLDEEQRADCGILDGCRTPLHAHPPRKRPIRRAIIRGRCAA
mgnify:CR=1 FL=1